MRLRPEMLAAAYDFLRTTDPFRRWRLPHSDEVQFRVGRERWMGWYQSQPHTISVSEKYVFLTDSVVRVMAHEVIHLHQELRRLTTPNTMHNADFQRRADRVCKLHGFDRGMFWT